MSTEPTTAVVVEDPTFKVFVGNLAFSITEDELKEAFSKAGAVVGSNIIVRNTRSLGYGFISYETEQEALRAVEMMDKADLAGRALNVQFAKPKVVGGERAAAPRQKKNRGAGRAAAAGAAPAADGADAAASGEGGDSTAPPRKRRGPKPEARIDQDGEQTGEAAEGDAPRPRSTRRKPKARKPRSANADGTTGDAVSGADAGEVAANDESGNVGGRRRAGGRTRGERKPQVPADGPLSKTMLFVANLPFRVDNGALADIFKDYKVTSAKVVTLRNGRSKGFGFVELADEAEQTRVINELQNVNVEGRDLVIKVALQSSHNAEGAEQQ